MSYPPCREMKLLVPCIAFGCGTKRVRHMCAGADGISDDVWRTWRTGKQNVDTNRRTK